MKSAPGGDHCPNTTVTLLVANQGIAAGDFFQLGPVALIGAVKANSQVEATPRGAPPLTGNPAPPAPPDPTKVGRVPVFTAWIPADNTVVVQVGNPYDTDLVALATDLVIDVVAFPPQP